MISQLLAKERMQQEERLRAAGAGVVQHNTGNATPRSVTNEPNAPPPASRLSSSPPEQVVPMLHAHQDPVLNSTGAAIVPHPSHHPDPMQICAGTTTSGSTAPQHHTPDYASSLSSSSRVAPISINTHRNTQQDWDAALQSSHHGQGQQRYQSSSMTLVSAHHPSHATPNTAPIPIPRSRRKSGDDSASSSMPSASSLPDRFSYEKFSLSPCSPIHVRRGFPSLASLRVPTPDEQKREVIKAQKMARHKARLEKKKRSVS